MPCFKPKKAWRDYPGAKLRFVPRSGESETEPDLFVPCGWCLGCRLQKRLDWTLRCIAEMHNHEDCCFITLTYNDSHLVYKEPLHVPTLVKSDLSAFLKRLRRKLDKLDCKVRFFACGEYGELNQRPHYHICLFGWKPGYEDFYNGRMTSAGSVIWQSHIIESCWDKGLSSVGELNDQTIAYTAGYIMKKIVGDVQDAHYLGAQPEFNNMSRRPGIGADWWTKYHSDLYGFDIDGVCVFDHLEHDGKLYKVPRFFDEKLRLHDHEKFIRLKEHRASLEHSEVDYETLARRLACKEYVAAKALQEKKGSIND